MGQGRCKGDIFFAPAEGEIRCAGAGTSTDIKEGMQCKIVCNAAYPTPEQIKCLNTGWDHESATCDATAKGLPPGGQIAMIMLALLVLCGGTFLYQRWRKQQEDKNNPEKDKNVNDINNVPHPEKNFDRNRVQGMGRDGCDNLQTCAMNEHSPLPQPKTDQQMAITQLERVFMILWERAPLEPSHN